MPIYKIYYFCANLNYKILKKGINYIIFSTRLISSEYILWKIFTGLF